SLERADALRLRGFEEGHREVLAREVDDRIVAGFVEFECTRGLADDGSAGPDRPGPFRRADGDAFALDHDHNDSFPNFRWESGRWPAQMGRQARASHSAVSGSTSGQRLIRT